MGDACQTDRQWHDFSTQGRCRTNRAKSIWTKLQRRKRVSVPGGCCASPPRCVLTWIIVPTLRSITVVWGHLLVPTGPSANYRTQLKAILWTLLLPVWWVTHLFKSIYPLPRKPNFARWVGTTEYAEIYNIRGHINKTKIQNFKNMRGVHPYVDPSGSGNARYDGVNAQSNLWRVTIRG